MAVPPITPLPQPPSRLTDPANFSEEADEFLGALPQFQIDTNTVAAYAEQMAGEAESERIGAESARNAAQAAASTAASATNFKGEWSNLSGPLNMPATVYHANKYWQLLSNLADVTTAEPGVSASWAQIAGVLDSYQEFTSSGTWTKPPLATWVYVEAIGGGSGGSRYSGGGGGGFNCKVLLASDVAASVAVTVGAGGAGSTSTSSANGGDSSFGSYLTAKGGQGTSGGGGEGLIPSEAFAVGGYSSGAGCTSGQGGSAVKGGAGGGGISGTAGQSGGVSIDGGNGGNGVNGGNGQNGSAPGGGGGRGGSANTGGNGAPGRVRVWAW